MTKVYIADDGTEFATKRDCMRYEDALKDVETADNSGLKEALITMAEYCHRQIDCWSCPMIIKDGCILQSKSPNYWLCLKQKEEKI